MNSAAETAKITTVELASLSDENRRMIEMQLTLEEFTNLVEISYNGEWRKHEWRVRGNSTLNDWIYDHLQSRDEVMSADSEIIKFAYYHFREIQKRKGQVTFSATYQKNLEISVIPRRNSEHATVYFVQDCVDLKWRWATAHWVVNGGASSPLSLRYNIVPTKNEAILAGAEHLKQQICRGWEFKRGEQSFKTFVNKIDKFIYQFKAQMIQPSLFG